MSEVIYKVQENIVNINRKKNSLINFCRLAHNLSEDDTYIFR